MNCLSKAAFAKHIGKNRAYVRQLQQLGRLVLDGDQVIVDQTLALIEATKDPSKQGVIDRHQAEREQKQSGAADLSAQSDVKTGQVYQKSKAMREQYNALTAKAEYEQMIGLLLPIADVRAAVADGDVIIRNRLESLPDVLSPQLAAEKDEQKIRIMLADYIEQTLADLSNKFKQLSKQI
jgi:hypothetical protein